MAPDPVHADRAAALGRLGPADLAASLASLPHVTHALGTCPTHGRLVAALADPKLIRMTLEMLSAQAFQLLMVAKAYGGRMTAAQLSSEAEPIGADRIAAIVDELATKLLVDRSAAGIALRIGVGDFVASPGQSFAMMAEYGSINSDELAKRLRLHGVAKPPTKKADRIQLLLAVFADGEALRNTLEAMTPAAQELFAHLVADGANGSNITDLGLQSFELGLVRYATYGRRFDRAVISPGAQAVIDLQSFGLVMIDPYDGRIWVWREVVQAVTGRLITHWPAAWRGATVPFHQPAIRPPHSPSAMSVVLQRVRAEPIAGLKSGGVGVKTFREIAKRFGQSETTVALMFDLAERLGVVVEHSQQVGRGRNMSWQYQYSIAGEALEAFEDLPAVDQWRHIVTVWIDGHSHSSNAPLLSFILRQILADLVALAPDEAVAEHDFVDWIERRHLIASNLDIGRSIVHLRALDLIEPTGPIALTSLARTLLTDPRAVATMLPDLDDRFVVQADHTVMAPPSLDPKIRTRLESIATLVSDGGMRVYRLDAARIAHTLSANETADELVAFLAETSSVPLPDVVSRLIIDTDRARGGLTVAAAATIVTASDVLGLAAALKVKAAKLTMVAPTVAVSDLSPARVATALRAKGLAPATAGVTIAVEARPISHLRQVGRPSASKAASSTALVLDRDALAAVAEAVAR